MKISFDFDSTLTREDIQEIADDFINRGHDVHITTSRHSKSRYKLVGGGEIPFPNKDLFGIAENLGIPKENIHFTEMQDKVDFLEASDDALISHLIETLDYESNLPEFKGHDKEPGKPLVEKSKHIEYYIQELKYRQENNIFIKE